MAGEQGKACSDDLLELQATIIRNVSHELRTPLGIILGYAELLHAGDLGELSPQQQEATLVIVNRVQKMRALVEKIDTLMALEAHAGVTMPFALDQVVAEAVGAMRAEAQQAGIDVEVLLESNLPMVAADPHHVRQAVSCLIDNAIKFTPRNGQIRVQVCRDADDICMMIRDTGIGMRAEDLEHVFTRFYQVDGSTARRYGGMGLGLAVVKEVVEEYGGVVGVESQPGLGSRFEVRFPSLPADVRFGQLGQGVANVRRILIVDDDSNVALTLQDGLEKLPNSEIAIASGGEEALRLFQEQPYDLLITDYKMPDMDGLTLARHIREQYPRTAVIMITAYGDDALQGQVNTYVGRVLDKPVRLAEIRNVAIETLGEPESESGSVQ